MPPDIREQVRQRANYACEYCGVSETDCGGELTIDHFQPKSFGGSDDQDNLVYCCTRCNQYKMDYCPATPEDMPLWNPRQEPPSKHFLELDDGTLHALTPTGAFAMKRLRLNRPPLVAYRLRRKENAETARLLSQYRELAQLLTQLQSHSTALLKEQQELLTEQKRLLTLLLGSPK